MEPDRFDDLSRSLATRTSRRDAVRRFGRGGLLATVASALGIREVIAQDQPELTTCELNFEAIVAVGPGLNTRYAGRLRLVIDGEGAINSSELDTGQGSPLPVIGESLRRALNLRIRFEDDTVLALNGMGQNDLRLCRGAINGLFTGPEKGSVGTWFATTDRVDPWQNVIPGAGEQPGSQQTPSSSAPSATAPAGQPAPTATAAPTQTEPTATSSCPQVDCGATMVLDPTTCLCECPEPFDRCGNTCCNKGSTCDPNSSTCACPSGTEPCQNVCTTSCGPLQYLDPTTCACVDGCLPGLLLCGGTCIDPTTDPTNCSNCGIICPGGGCVNSTCCNSLECSVNADCCSGYCQSYGASGKQCSTCSGTICGESYCASLNSDPYNCGACGHQCDTGAECQNGVCIGPLQQ